MLASSPGLDSCFIIYKSWERRGRRGFRHEFPLQEKNYKWVDQYQEYVSLSRDLHSFHLTSDQVFTFDASQAYSSSFSWSSKSSYSVNLYLCWISKEYRLGKASKIEKEKSKKQRWCHLLSIYKSVKALNQKILYLSMNREKRIVSSLCMRLSLRHH